MKRYIQLTLLLGITASSCKKEDKRQYSEWYVNGNVFKTNDIRVEKGKATHELIGNDQNNRFGLILNLGYFPTTDSFIMNCSQQNPKWVCFAIVYNGNGYYPRHVGYIRANSLNGKGSYALQPTWFINESLPTDTILVHGTFNEP